MSKYSLLILTFLIHASGDTLRAEQFHPSTAKIAAARYNADFAQEGFRHAHRYLQAWLGKRIPPSGLIPKNEDYRIWEPKNAAADNYAFMVLTAAFTDHQVLDGAMREMLEQEKRLTSRSLNPGEPAVLPDDFNLDTNRFQYSQPSVDRMTYGASEYCKDGLMPVLEWLGPETPWFDRMTEMLDFLWTRHAVGRSAQGQPIPRAKPEPNWPGDVEAHGEMLQVLPRLYWATGEQKYLDWATRLGNHYLLADHHPTRNFESLRLRDHGSEVVSGLSELYVTLRFVDSEKADQYQEPLYEMLERILEVGRNEDGLFLNEINPQTGAVVERGLADTFGYVYNAYYAVWQVDRHSSDEQTRKRAERFRSETRRALTNLNQPKYRNFRWERDQADGYADAIEGALNLYNRERDLVGVAEWLDSETRVMWAMQQPSGLINEGHPDGNFARTTLLMCLWRTRGVWTRNWRSDLRFGATELGDGILLTVSADDPWDGDICFDVARHECWLHLPIDWARINQFPEWFTVNPQQKYRVTELNMDGGQSEPRQVTGAELVTGLPVKLQAGQERLFLVAPAE